MADDDLEEHISHMSALLVANSPASPDDEEEAEITEREEMEQREIFQFNLAYLDIKPVADLGF